MRVRTALVGCGKVGAIHAQALAGLPESEFVGVCDASAARAEAFGARFGVAGYDNVTTLLRDARPQALCIATPHPLHAGPALLALEAGAHVLVEKPLASNLRDCDAMLAAAVSSGAILSVVSQRRLIEPVLRLKAAIDANKIGRPVLGVVQMLNWRDQAYYQSDPWRGTWAGEGGGVLVNQAPHLLDLLQWLMGDAIAEIFGYWGNLNHPTVEVEDTAVAGVRFRLGGLASIVTSVSQKPGLYAKVHIHGANGASVGVETDAGPSFVAGMSQVAAAATNDIWTVPGEEHRLAQFQAEDRARFAEIDATSHYHALQIRDFLQSILHQRAPLVSGADGRTVVAMFTAIYRSQRERRPIAFPVSGEG